MTEIKLQFLGQSGCRIEYGGISIYMDPYLSHSIQELDSPDLERLIPIPIQPAEVNDADWVLISHDHIDHCDPRILPLLAKASRNCRFIGPQPVIKKLLEWEIPANQIQVADEHWKEIDNIIKIRALPAAHPEIERDANGNLKAVGYILEIDSARVYLAGDTSLTDELLETLISLRPISATLLPVNERNFFHERRGIIGNMSVRDAFLLADEIGIKIVIPVHWDMFEANSVSPDEIKAVYQRINPSFELQMQPTSIML